MRIEFVFDTVCPWCFIGKRRFERALAARPGPRIQVVWRPFLLNPDLPADGVDRSSYLDRKFGGPARINRMHGAVAAAGRTEGIDFAFDRIKRTPNSLQSHRLIRFAARFGRESETVDALYRAYFCEGRDIGRLDELAAIAAETGLAARDAADFLHSDAEAAATMGDNARSHRLGVNGVPCVIVDGLYAMAGAQDPDILIRLFDVAREAEAEAALS